ncbi:hypothetical protein O181_056848 [Austropuccinia psidii MF-1]|uniref:Uncharacterized protein n=1 Tax=Austropuccinia psidii MF-1 TaxID=1389203 RepID=A0A9Q3HTV6_9BASI|nr:hypothetical protein [Austropuccinia psidii MF-1]
MRRRWKMKWLEDWHTKAQKSKNSEYLWLAASRYEKRPDFSNYVKALQELIEIFDRTLRELEEVNQEIRSLSQSHLTRSAGLSSVLLFTRPATSSSSEGESKSLQSFSSFGMKESKLDLSTDLPPDVGILPEEIVDKIDESSIGNVVKELNRILRELSKLSIEGRPLEDQTGLCRATRVLFETHIFQALNFLYENELCNQKVLRKFFSTENTLERTQEERAKKESSIFHSHARAIFCTQ